MTNTILAEVHKVFDRLYNLKADENDQPIAVTFAAAALHTWKRWWTSNQGEVKEATDSVSGALAKMQSQALRLILICHLTRWAAGEADDHDRIDEESMACGTRIADYFKGHLARVHGALGAGPDEVRDRRVLDYLKRKENPGVTRRHLVTNKVAGIKRAEEAKQVLDRLVGRGCGEWRAQERKPSGQQGPDQFYLK